MDRIGWVGRFFQQAFPAARCSTFRNRATILISGRRARVQHRWGLAATRDGLENTETAVIDLGQDRRKRSRKRNKQKNVYEKVDLYHQIIVS